MPTLDWIGKQAVVHHDKDVPFRLLKRDRKLSIGDSEHLLVKGDNLEALKALMPYYVGKVQCIYIDPPYNTGTERWIYNDAVNAPEIRKWLGKVVGKQEEDLTRHDKWLCMMYPRLSLLREMLSETGAICVSIAEEEIATLRLLLNEIFGEHNYRNTLVVRRYDKNINRQFLSKGLRSLNVGVEYVVIYSKSDRFVMRPVFREASEKRSTQGYWKGFWNAADRPTMRYELLGVTPEEGQWKWKKDVAMEAVNNYEHYLKKYSSLTLEKYWQKEAKDKGLKFIRRNPRGRGVNKGVEHWIPPSEGILRSSNWTDTLASQSLSQFDLAFDNPKNVEVIKQVIQLCSDEDSIILDSFAGSGTTGHAVLDLNNVNGGTRQCILVEMEDDIAEKVTAKRLQKVIKSYEGNAETHNGFQFMRLDATLFNAHGSIAEPVTYKDLARYVFFTETRKDLNEKGLKKPFIGSDGESDYFLLFTEKGKNTLTREKLSSLKESDKQKVIYADRCLLSESSMKKANAVFKQIPYHIKVY
ncbi:site-specific DNA-methyltransferase [Candidatus Peribacteria bacterium]|nr:site-specific DNA-methyltransferase [Candidatus Peribacteria bacterium]